MEREVTSRWLDLTPRAFSLVDIREVRIFHSSMALSLEFRHDRGGVLTLRHMRETRNLV